MVKKATLPTQQVILVEKTQFPVYQDIVVFFLYDRFSRSIFVTMIKKQEDLS